MTRRVFCPVFRIRDVFFRKADAVIRINYE